MIRYKFLSGDVNWQIYGGKFVSQKLNNGDWDYWLVMEVINMHEATGEENQPKYNVEIKAVSPQAVKEYNPKNLDSAIGSCGWSDAQIDSMSELMEVETLSDYGIFAVLWSDNGNNLKSLMQSARKESQLIDMLFGFYMDKQENRIGQTGWDLIRGQNIREYFNGLNL